MSLEYSELFKVGVWSAIIGFSVYFISCALHVWRNRHLQENRPPSSRAPCGPTRVVLLGIAVGSILIGWAFLQSAWSQPRGSLRGNGLWVFRQPQEFSLAWMTSETRIKKGQPVARLQPEISRQVQELDTERRHLESSLSEYTIELSRLMRELWRDRVDKEDQLKKMQLDMQSLQLQLTQAVARVTFSRGSLQRTENLYKSDLVSTEQKEEHLRELQIDDAEVRRVHDSLDNLQKQKDALQNGLNELLHFQKTESVDFQKKQNELQSKIAFLSQAEARLQGSPPATPPAPRAAALPGTVEIKAPFDAFIAFRNASPQAAKKDEPLLVLAPPEGLLIYVRLPAWQEHYLASGKSVLFEAPNEIAPAPEVHQPVLEKRFTGTLVSWKSLPLEPKIRVAEFDCRPPEDILNALVEGNSVSVRMRWKPPVWLMPSFRWGACIVLASVLGSAILLLARGKQPPPSLESGSGHRTPSVIEVTTRD